MSKKLKLSNYTTDWLIRKGYIEDLEHTMNQPLDNTQENMWRVLNGEYRDQQQYLRNQIDLAKSELHDIEFQLYFNGATPQYLHSNGIELTSVAMSYFEKNIKVKT